MRHWLRDFPDVDETFIAQHLAPIKALHAERRAINRKIAEAEHAAVSAASDRWSPAKITQCSAQYLSN